MTRKRIRKRPKPLTPQSTFCVDAGVDEEHIRYMRLVDQFILLFNRWISDTYEMRNAFLQRQTYDPQGLEGFPLKR